MTNRNKCFTERGRKYPGCWFQYVRKLGSIKEMEKVYYCKFRNPDTDKVITARFRRESENGTLARCSHYRSDLINGRKLPPQLKKKVRAKYNIESMWEKYIDGAGLEGKAGWRSDKHRYEKYIKEYYRGRLADEKSVDGFTEISYVNY